MPVLFAATDDQGRFVDLKHGCWLLGFDASALTDELKVANKWAGLHGGKILVYELPEPKEVEPTFEGSLPQLTFETE